MVGNPYINRAVMRIEGYDPAKVQCLAERKPQLLLAKAVRLGPSVYIRIISWCLDLPGFGPTLALLAQPLLLSGKRVLSHIS